MRRSAQDDGFVRGLEYNWLNMQKHEKIEKVTGSRDDDFVGVLRKTFPNRLALMRRSSFNRFKRAAAKSKDPRALSESIGRFSFRPTYAGVNMGHSSGIEECAAPG